MTGFNKYALTQRAIDEFDSMGIPRYMRGGLQRYVEDGTPPGEFLQAVINNDLKRACERADLENRTKLFNYVHWLYHNAPNGSWGFDGAVKKYVTMRREERKDGKSTLDSG